MEQALHHLGISKNGSQTYLALLAVGETSVGKLIEKTGLHPQLIYNALDELQRAELTTFTLQRGRRYYQPVDPNRLLEIAQAKLTDIKQVIPQLFLQYEKQKHQAVFVYSGDEAFRQARLKLIRDIPRGGTYYVVGTGAKLFMQAMEGTFQEIENVRIQRRISKKLIGFSDIAEYTESYRPDAQLEERRYLAGQYQSPTTTIFGGKKLALIVWSQPILTVVIESKELVQGYEVYFDLLWNQAQPHIMNP